MCFGANNFDVEMFCQAHVQPYIGNRLTTTDLAMILSHAPTKYHDKVASRVLQLHRGI